MAKLKINKKALYQKTLEQALEVENYESAAVIRDYLPTIPDDEIIEVDDEEIPEKTDEEECV